MRKPIGAVAADLHLSKCAWVKHPGLEGDSYYSFEQISDYCIKENISPLLLAGDVLDKTRPDATTIAKTNSIITKLRNAAIEIYYVQGQHELDRVQPWLSAISTWPQHIHRSSHKLMSCGLYVYGFDWTPADAVQAEFETIPSNTDILISHQVWLDLMGPHIGGAECKFADVPHVRALITGDFHRHMTMDVLNRDRQNKIGRASCRERV